MDRDDPQPEVKLGEVLLAMEDVDKEGLSEAHIQQILEHNCALRRNFETLKQLHLQLTDAHLQLHEACLQLHDEKEALEQITRDINETRREKEALLSRIEDMKLNQEKEIRHLKRERDDSSAKAEDLENRVRSFEKFISTYKAENTELVLQIERIRVEKDQALARKHCTELEHSRDLMALKAEDQTARQQAADLAHKCKHLEMDFAKSLNAAEATKQELFAVTFEKDSTITNLKDSLRRMEEDIFAQQEHWKKCDKEWECERKRLLQTIETKDWHDQQMLRAKEEAEVRLKEDFELKITILQREKEESERLYKEEADLCIKEALVDIRYEEERQRELRRTLEGEAIDLRAMLTAMEQASTDAETRHTQSIKELTKECESLRRELIEIKDKEQQSTEALKSLRKENAELLAEIEGLREQLNDTLSTNHESYNRIAEYRRALDDYHRQVELLRIELHDLEKRRERDEEDFIRGLEDAKRSWAAEKMALKMKDSKFAEEQRRTLTEKNQALKTKLKESNRLLATMTVDHNQLLIRTREIETQLSLARPTRLQSDLIVPRSGTALERSCTNAAWLKDEMAQLEKRQARFLFRGEQSYSGNGDKSMFSPPSKMSSA